MNHRHRAATTYAASTLRLAGKFPDIGQDDRLDTVFGP